GITAYSNTPWDAGSLGFELRGRSGKARHDVANNVSYRDRDGVLVDVQTSGGTKPIERSNSWSLAIIEPRFISTSVTDAGFLQLSSNSPAIDVGVDVGLAYYGNAPDLGAVEST